MQKKTLVRFIGLILLFFVIGFASCKNNPTETLSDNPSDELLADKTKNNDDDEDDSGRATIPFADAEAFFEFNTTDNDLGLQIFLDAEGWDKVRIRDAQGKKIVQVLTQGPLSKLGITEFRFESAEPSPAEVLSLFPPGEYDFQGKTVDGLRLHSIAELSHDFLTAPTISPSNGEEVDPTDLIVSWNAPGAELVEIIIESEESDNVFDVVVAGDITSLNIPNQFLEAGLEYKLEILAYAENGNRTIVETSFITSE